MIYKYSFLFENIYTSVVVVVVIVVIIVVVAIAVVVVIVVIIIINVTITIHLCFKQAQPKICHSPKVDDGVDIFFKSS